MTIAGDDTEGVRIDVLRGTANEEELAALLAEIENLSDDEAAKLLADEERTA